jgi:hypothetical protein
VLVTVTTILCWFHTAGLGKSGIEILGPEIQKNNELLSYH